MTEETVLVVGLGEVGQTMLELLKESGKFRVYGFDVDKKKMHALKQKKPQRSVDTMHICIPCGNREGFANTVTDYINHFRPKLVVINSTVMPGETMDIHRHVTCLVAHSPIRGVHENPDRMKWEVKRWTKYVGGADLKSGEAACNHFKKLGLKTKLLKSCVETELAKLFETTYRAWMITCFQEMNRISNWFKADFDQSVDFLEDTHRVRFDRPIMFPGVIGGHCLIPNIELLLNSYDSEFLRLILTSNRRRIEEIKDENVRNEAEKVKKRMEVLQKKLTGTNH